MVVAMIEFPKMTGYIIYNPETKLFAKGTMSLKWSRVPKIWTGTGPLKTHLSQSMVYSNWAESSWTVSNAYVGCVVFEVITQKPAFDIYDYIHDYIIRSFKSSSRYYEGWSIIWPEGVDKPMRIL